MQAKWDEMFGEKKEEAEETKVMKPRKKSATSKKMVSGITKPPVKKTLKDKKVVKKKTVNKVNNKAHTNKQISIKKPAVKNPSRKM